MNRTQLNLAEPLLLLPPMDRYREQFRIVQLPRANAADQYKKITDLLPLDQITIAPELTKDHPLAKYFLQSEPISSKQLKVILSGPDINPVLTLLHEGRIPAAFYPDGVVPLEGNDTSYDRSEWNRDALIISAALRRGGNWNESFAILKLLWNSMATEPELRNRIISFRDCDDGLARTKRGEWVMPVKWSLGDPHKIHVFNNWSHRQLDANWETIGGPFRFACELAEAQAAGKLPLTVNPLELALESLDPEYKKHGTHILMDAVEALLRIGWDMPHDGIWESYPSSSGTHGILAGVAALDEAERFFERFGWDALPHNEREDGLTFKELFKTQLAAGRAIIKERIPEEGYATERRGRPHDMALTLAMCPFVPSHESLSSRQFDTLARTGYDFCMTPQGFIRWDNDKKHGPDTYLSGGYMQDPAVNTKGEFGKLPDNWKTGQDWKNDWAASWTMFDPIYVGGFARRYIESSGGDVEAFLRTAEHMKRSFSQTTKQEYIVNLAGKDGAPFVIPKGVLPEAWVWSLNGELVPAHNGALQMSHGLLGIALERYAEALEIFESGEGQKHYKRYVEWKSSYLDFQI